jgi:hypothetical protein
MSIDENGSGWTSADAAEEMRGPMRRTTEVQCGQRRVDLQRLRDALGSGVADVVVYDDDGTIRRR